MLNLFFRKRIFYAATIPWIIANCRKHMTSFLIIFIRLVNGFMENAHKKTGRSISELAEAVGIPRVLVDIRHG